MLAGIWNAILLLVPLRELPIVEIALALAVTRLVPAAASKVTTMLATGMLPFGNPDPDTLM